MQQRYFAEPYEFVPPYRSSRWCRALQRFHGRFARTTGVHQIDVRGAPLLRESLNRGAGVLLAPNHCGTADLPALAKLGLDVGAYFHFLASYHVFKQRRLFAFLFRRVGGFSIFREGADRESIRECVRILVAAERPLALFPEGTWTRTSDRVGPFQSGAALILRQAQKKTEHPLALHPVALKYWHLGDPRPAMDARLSRMEKLLRWRPQTDLPLVSRLLKLNSAILAVKEIEYFGSARPGGLDERIQQLAEFLIRREEARNPSARRPELMIERIRVLRTILVKRLQENPGDNGELFARLDDLLTAELLYGQDQSYLLERPTIERFSDALLRTEEDLFDSDEPVGKMGVVVDVGPALSVQDIPHHRGAADPLLTIARDWIQERLQRLSAEGPPASWNCPPPVLLPIERLQSRTAEGGR